MVQLLLDIAQLSLYIIAKKKAEKRPFYRLGGDILWALYAIYLD